MLWQAIVSSSPADDWTKGRVLAMVLTVLVLAWSASEGLQIALSGLDAGADEQRLAPGWIGRGEDGDSNLDVAGREGRQLRKDLFKAPAPAKRRARQEPKTNPAELLRLIELQGVLGGENPRAMVMYRRTQESVTVSVGDDLGEFEVVEIRKRSVVLKWREELFELSL